jgi:hypothetical protein
VGYYVTFPRTNYESKKALVWNLRDIHHDMSLPFEPSVSKFPKPNTVIIYPGLYIKINN